MPFIGQEPLTGAYSVLDDITTSATATYNLQLNGGAYSPASANNLLVSLNGVIQKPGSSFTISGSQITFSSALTSSDSIDFIMALGDVLSVGTPTDGTVDGNKLASNIGISTTGNIATTGNLDVNTIRHTNGTTALTIDTAGRIQQPTKPAFSVLVGATTTGKDFTSGPQALDEFTLIEFNIGSHLVLNSGNAKFTAPVGGVYSFNSMLQLGGHTTATHASSYFIIDSTFSGSHNRYHRSINDIAGEDYFTAESAAIIQLNANQTVEMGIYIHTDTTVQVREGTRFMGHLIS